MFRLGNRRRATGAGPRESDAANWSRVLKADRDAAFRSALAVGVSRDNLARACWMTPKRVSQIVDHAPTGQRRATGRPTGRPKRKQNAATIERERQEDLAA